MTREQDRKSITAEDSIDNSWAFQSTGRDTKSENSETFKASLTKRESATVLKLRILVILILLLAGIAVCLVVYFIARDGETEDFESQYEGAAGKVIDSYEGILNRIGSISSLGVAATIEGMAQDNGGWPFVTLPSFQQRATTARQLSGALYVILAPLVTDDKRDQWETYVVGDNKDWIAEGIQYQEEVGMNKLERHQRPLEEATMVNHTRKNIFYYNDRQEKVIDSGPGPYLPSWQTSPVLLDKEVNENLFKYGNTQGNARECMEHNEVVFGSFQTAPPGFPGHYNTTTDFFATLQSYRENETVEYLGDPMARLYIPVYNSFDKDRENVGVMIALVNWRHYFEKILPKNIEGVTVVLENTCDGYFTFEINGEEVSIIGFDDHHDTQFDKYTRTGTLSQTVKIADGTQQGLHVDPHGCQYKLHVYPSKKFINSFYSKTPILITFAVAMVFIFAVLMFLVYDRLVEIRQRIVLSKAAHSTAIVSSLFPKQVRDILLAEGDEKRKNDKNRTAPGSQGIASLMDDMSSTEVAGSSRIADLFPNCTVLFADIAGFTAWSSTREPDQVFILLQTIYQSFDYIAKRRRVFKVETIGDCYLAVTGLPEPQKNHAILMSRFAWDCRLKMRDLTRELEVTLGPDTGDLVLRVGMHSGPVTAGVLRGDRARFQLFGDTVNTASRMESNGVRDKIQISQSTADILLADGKGHWITPREELVEAKGKGMLKTFWLNPGVRSKGSSTTSSETGSNSDSCRDSGHASLHIDIRESNEWRLQVKEERLIDWMVELLLEHFRKMAAKRHSSNEKNGNMPTVYHPPSGNTCLDEMQEVIPIADFNTVGTTENWRNIDIQEEIISATREYVSLIAKSYQDVPFHNFEHACHVTMSLNKLLKRIVAPEISEEDFKVAKENNCLPAFINKYTYGISGDPLALLAIVFSALIHDVDHGGISNTQLMKEKPEMGKRYRSKSVAEQNSLDLAWDLLMMERFASLRAFIFGNQDELLRFRKFVVNSVMATDIFDKELNAMRNDRWQKAFEQSDGSKEDMDRKATIVIEHIIQASDVSHTMQHWHIYRKWNKRLFQEMCLAFRDGRMGADPRKFWYEAELGFFDSYVIPLAKKLKDCNVFGVCGDEYLNYAVCNRTEWEQKGKSIIKEIICELGFNADADE